MSVEARIQARTVRVMMELNYWLYFHTPTYTQGDFMADFWLPSHNRTRETENGSTLSFMDHDNFKDIGRLAHEVGELQRHGEPNAYENEQLKKEVDKLSAGLNPLDQLQIFSAVAGYVQVAATHPAGSRICVEDPHHELASLAEGELYQKTGLAADLLKVCP